MINLSSKICKKRVAWDIGKYCVEFSSNSNTYIRYNRRCEQSGGYDRICAAGKTREFTCKLRVIFSPTETSSSSSFQTTRSFSNPPTNHHRTSRVSKKRAKSYGHCIDPSRPLITPQIQVSNQTNSRRTGCNPLPQLSRIWDDRPISISTQRSHVPSTSTRKLIRDTKMGDGIITIIISTDIIFFARSKTIRTHHQTGWDDRRSPSGSSGTTTIR